MPLAASHSVVPVARNGRPGSPRCSRDELNPEAVKPQRFLPERVHLEESDAEFIRGRGVRAFHGTGPAKFAGREAGLAIDVTGATFLESQRLCGKLVLDWPRIWRNTEDRPGRNVSARYERPIPH